MLELAAGKVRCGSCLNIFYAIDNIITPLSDAGEDSHEAESVFISHEPGNYFDPATFLTRKALQEGTAELENTPSGETDRQKNSNYDDNPFQLTNEHTKSVFGPIGQSGKDSFKKKEPKEFNLLPELKTTGNYFEDFPDPLLSEIESLNPELFSDNANKLKPTLMANTEQYSNQKQDKGEDKHYRKPLDSVKKVRENSAISEIKPTSKNGPKGLHFTPNPLLINDATQQSKNSNTKNIEHTEKNQLDHLEPSLPEIVKEAENVDPRKRSNTTNPTEKITGDLSDPENFTDTSSNYGNSTQDQLIEDNSEIIRARALRIKPDEVSLLESLSEENIAAMDVSSAPLEFVSGTQSKWGRRIFLSILVIILIGGLAFQYLWLNMPIYSQDKRIRPLYEFSCDYIKCKLPNFIDINAIRSDRLTVRSHPELENALSVNIQFRNTAAYPQAFPLILLSFNSTNNDIVALREFSPQEYLDSSLHDFSMMPIMSPVQVSLEIIDPGPGAVNYTLAFREP